MKFIITAYSKNAPDSTAGGIKYFAGKNKIHIFATKFSYKCFIGKMGTKDKLVERFKRLPKDFTYEEVLRLMKIFGYSEYNKGSTSGSRVRFVKDKGDYLDIHKPHPGSIMKLGVLRSILAHLKEHDNLK